MIDILTIFHIISSFLLLYYLLTCLFDCLSSILNLVQRKRRKKRNGCKPRSSLNYKWTISRMRIQLALIIEWPKRKKRKEIKRRYLLVFSTINYNSFLYLLYCYMFIFISGYILQKKTSAKSDSGLLEAMNRELDDVDLGIEQDGYCHLSIVSI